MRLTVAGSGTAAPEPERACSGYFIEQGETRVLLDCGPGVVHHLARFGLPWHRLNHLVITHFHNDHIGDIPMLLFAMKWGTQRRRMEPLTVWGPQGVADRMRRLTAAFGDHVRNPGFPLDIRELRPGTGVQLSGDLTLEPEQTPHTAESLAFRLEAAGGGALGYTGDTGPSAEVGAFMSGCDVLIAECSLPDDAAIPTHLSPSSLAALAGRAAPGLLIVTHVYPWLDAKDPLRRLHEAGWTGPAARAEDGMSLEIPR